MTALSTRLVLRRPLSSFFDRILGNQEAAAAEAAVTTAAKEEVVSSEEQEEPARLSRQQRHAVERVVKSESSWRDVFVREHENPCRPSSVNHLILNIINAHGPMTTGEVWDFMEPLGVHHATKSKVRRALGVLRRRSIVRSVYPGKVSRKDPAVKANPELLNDKSWKWHMNWLKYRGRRFNDEAELNLPVNEQTETSLAKRVSVLARRAAKIERNRAIKCGEIYNPDPNKELKY